MANKIQKKLFLDSFMSSQTYINFLQYILNHDTKGLKKNA